MSKDQFVVTNSITWRLKAVMMVIAVFFILSALGIYVSSLGFLQGLRDINSANQVFNLTNQAIEGLETSNQNVGKLPKSRNIKDVEFAFNESQKILKVAVKKAIIASHTNPDVEALLNKSSDAVLLYDESVQHLFSKFSSLNDIKTKSHIDDLNSELLITTQFATDAIELLRKAQINLRNDTDRSFAAIYANRFRPLLVAISLSAIFFLFVITFGFRISNKIAASVKNLRNATDKVSEGNLFYQAPILDHDEFGLLTDTFNLMVLSLGEGRATLDYTIDRIRSLQKITASFSEALTADQVIEVTVRDGFEALEAKTGSVVMVNPEGTEIELKKSIGYGEETDHRWKTFSINSPNPISDAIRAKEPKFLSSTQEIFSQYPTIKEEVESHQHQSMVCIPLMIGDVCLGGIILCFNYQKIFSQSEKDFMVAIGRQCAQALHRAKLYDDSRNAIQARDEFLSIASHELKTPLTPLKLQLQILARQFKNGDTSISPEKFAKVMANSDSQLNRLSRLIEDLLDVSRITAGKLRLNLEVHDLKKITEEVMTQYGHQLQDILPHIEIDADPGIMCLVDDMRIEQVIINLLTNAVKYAPGKPIKVSVKRVKNMAKICIKDEGPGIAEENKERIFKRFERVKATDNIGGLGLGLYISHQIIEAHQGKIYVESEPGAGSNFIIELPLVA